VLERDAEFWLGLTLASASSRKVAMLGARHMANAAPAKWFGGEHRKSAIRSGAPVICAERLCNLELLIVPTSRTAIRLPLLMLHGYTEGAAVPAVWQRVGIGDTHQRLRRPPYHLRFQVSAMQAARAVLPQCGRGTATVVAPPPIGGLGLVNSRGL
jgi:hypothetical protein